MPFDLDIGEVGLEQPKVEYPNDYVEWRRASYQGCAYIRQSQS